MLEHFNCGTILYMIVYKITNKINGKIYIGQTVQALKERWNKHCSVKRCLALSSAIKKYGKESFEIKVMVRCNSIEEMNHRETYYIKLFDTVAPKGYNLTRGGRNGKHVEETKKKIGDKQRGNRNHNFGKKASAETRHKMSASQKGRVKTPEERAKLSAANTGAVFSEERKKNISIALKGKPLTENHRQNIARGIKNSQSTLHRKKKVLCIENNSIYGSIADAAAELKTTTGKICAVLKGARKHTKGYTFKRV